MAAIVPLAPDEAYYWVWSRALQAGYLDHPPMVALWIRAGTWLLGDGSLGIRLLAPLSAALGSLLLARAAEDLFPGRRAGVAAAGLLNATLLFGVGSVMMTPDTPLLFFWTMALCALARMLATGQGAWWLAAGTAAGLALDSKYTAALLLAGAGLWLLAAPEGRKWLGRGWAWAGLALALALFAPVAAWNAGVGWAGFVKQGGRVGVFDPGRAAQFLGELLGGQAGLATPVVFVLCAAGAWAALRRWREPAWGLLAALIWVPLGVFVEHALGDRVQGNWPAILYPAAAIAAAGLERARRWVWPGVVLGLALTVLVWGQAASGLLPLPARADPTLRLAGWGGLASDAAAAARGAGASFVAADNYGVAAELARWLPPDIPVVGVGSRWRFFALPDAWPLMAGKPGLLVRSVRRGDDIPMDDWVTLAPAGEAVRPRHGVTAERFGLYRVVGRAQGAPAALMPRPGETP
jgi:4-amino-4-deoxy-L-arabinose transferase-like glycosyltransferase